MKQFLGWFNAPSGVPPDIDPVLKAAVAHIWFVTVHPFDDGNGRIARAIADMALAQADNTKERFYSMSSGIEAQRSEYYLQLESAQRGSLDITAWLAWFLRCLDFAIDDADKSLGSVLRKARLWERINQALLNERQINERQRRVINRMLNDFQGHLTTSKYAKLAKCSTDTALRDIRELLDSDRVDAVQRWRDAITTSDALLIACPEYGHSLPGVVKNSVDWVIGTGELEEKVVALTASVPGPERGLKGLEALRITLRAVRATLLGETIVRGEKEDEQVRALLAELQSRLA